MLGTAINPIAMLLLRVLPHRALSRLAHRVARIRCAPFKNLLIRRFILRYGVDMADAAQPDPSAYADFNEFFTRPLKAGARPVVARAGEIALPVDGKVSRCGPVEDGRLLQAKGIEYPLAALLGGSAELAGRFTGGCFATLYLAPRDYHRIHMPVDGTLEEMRYIPGRLFPVHPYSTAHVAGLFTRNERLVTLFDSPAGPLALVLVGAIFVSGIETVWHGRVRPGAGGGAAHWDYRAAPLRLARGAELGRFNMGSTVIVLFGGDRVTLAAELHPGRPVAMGGLLGRYRT